MCSWWQGNRSSLWTCEKKSHFTYDFTLWYLLSSSKCLWAVENGQWLRGQSSALLELGCWSEEKCKWKPHCEKARNCAGHSLGWQKPQSVRVHCVCEGDEAGIVVGHGNSPSLAQRCVSIAAALPERPASPVTPQVGVLSTQMMYVQGSFLQRLSQQNVENECQRKGNR